MASNMPTLDVNVLAALPNVAEVLDVEQAGQSRWAKGMRVTVQNEDGTGASYFLKISTGHHGREAILGEFEGTSAIYDTTPGFCPKPTSWGTFKQDPNTHFYLCNFYHFEESTMPNPQSFCANLAKLHTQSKSPTGKFGFHCATYNGDLRQDNNWCDSWQVFFAKATRQALELRDERAGSQSDELEALLPALFDKVIPRLLGPLEHSIMPVLIHGNLWYGNASVVPWTGGEGIVYDPAAFYGHNEYDLGNWRPARNKFTKKYFDAYHSHMPKSEPVEGYDDRLKLYEMRFNLNTAALLPDRPEYLQMVIDGIKELNVKFKG